MRVCVSICSSATLIHKAYSKPSDDTCNIGTMHATIQCRLYTEVDGNEYVVNCRKWWSSGKPVNYYNTRLFMSHVILHMYICMSCVPAQGDIQNLFGGLMESTGCTWRP